MNDKRTTTAHDNMHARTSKNQFLDRLAWGLLIGFGIAVVGCMVLLFLEKPVAVLVVGLYMAVLWAAMRLAGKASR